MFAATNNGGSSNGRGAKTEAFGTSSSQPFRFGESEQNQTTEDDMAMEDDTATLRSEQKTTFSFGGQLPAFRAQAIPIQHQPQQPCAFSSQFGKGVSAYSFGANSAKISGANGTANVSATPNAFSGCFKNSGSQNTFPLDSPVAQKPFSFSTSSASTNTTAKPASFAFSHTKPAFSLPALRTVPTTTNEWEVLSKTDICDSCNRAVGDSPEPYVIQRFQNSSSKKISVDDQQTFCSLICMARGVSEAYNDVYGDLEDD